MADQRLLTKQLVKLVLDGLGQRLHCKAYLSILQVTGAGSKLAA